MPCNSVHMEPTARMGLRAELHTLGGHEGLKP